MIVKKIFIIAAALMSFAATSQVLAQPATQPRPQTTAPITAQPAAPNIPTSKIAVIFSVVFQDPKQGIAKFNVLLTKLNGEFQKTQDDLNQTAQRTQALQDEITKLQGSAAPVDPKTVQAKIEQLDQLKKDYQRKGEDAQAAYQKRRNEIFGPLQQDVSKALDQYAKARGITLVIDGSVIEGVLYAADGMNITAGFVSDYNAKNPVTASTSTPR